MACEDASRLSWPHPESLRYPKATEYRLAFKETNDIAGTIFQHGCSKNQMLAPIILNDSRFTTMPGLVTTSQAYSDHLLTYLKESAHFYPYQRVTGLHIDDMERAHNQNIRHYSPPQYRIVFPRASRCRQLTIRFTCTLKLMRWMAEDATLTLRQKAFQELVLSTWPKLFDVVSCSLLIAGGFPNISTVEIEILHGWHDQERQDWYDWLRVANQHRVPGSKHRARGQHVNNLEHDNLLKSGRPNCRGAGPQSCCPYTRPCFNLGPARRWRDPSSCAKDRLAILMVLLVF